MSRAARRPSPTWDDVKEGEEIKGFALELTPTRMVAQVSGTQDFYPIHHDRAFAQQAGHKGIFINTAFIRGCLCRVVIDWIGDDGIVKSLGFQMRRPNYAGETIAARGRVKKKGLDGRVDLELWLENAGEVTVPGTATVILPVRA